MDATRKKIFFTSDWHIGHANVLKYDERPFKDLFHMNRVLINNFNSSVDKDCVTYFLGDMGMGKSEELTKVLKELNGIKVLILGNHDSPPNSMYARGFDVVMNGALLYIAQKRVSLAHCPLYGIFREDVSEMPNPKGKNWHGEFKNTMFTMRDDTVDYHLHGHIHSDNVKKKRQTENQYDVGVRANKYRPVSQSEIESWIALTEQAKAKK